MRRVKYREYIPLEYGYDATGRQVLIEGTGTYSDTLQDGFFHKFFQIFTEDSSYIVAIVETIHGRVIEVPLPSLIFVEPPTV